MEYESRQAVYIPVMDFLELELHLLETRPGMKPEAFIKDLLKRWLARDIERRGLKRNGTAVRGVSMEDIVPARRYALTHQVWR